MAVKKYEEFTLFDMIMPQYKIDPNKKLRIITTFSGYDSQALSLKYLGVKFEHYRTCEWAIKSIQALKDLHFSNDNTDYSKELTLDEVYNYLYNKGISSNYNEPMKLEQIKRLGEERARTIYNNIQATKNMVNIQQVKAEDLGIVEKDKYTYLLTYSFPCQDLSLAGLRKGMRKGESTRSGMLWEVERILDECKELNTLPNILFMENVPEVIGKNNIKDFQKWIEKLESLGYSNYVECLNSKDYGIPQNRNRCFMISVLGEYTYKFPQPFELKLRLKDLLESNVDEKYYLSNKMIKYITALNTNEGSRRCDASNYICEELPEEYDLKQIKNKCLKETIEKNKEELEHADFLDCYNRSVKKDIAGTITTGVSFRNETFVAVNEEDLEQKLVGGIGEKKSNNGTQYYQQDRIYDSNAVAMCHPAGLPSGSYMYQLSNLRIRKLTPRETFRLMGVKDEDFDKIKNNQSDSSLYHLAGDSIVVDVMYYMFKNLF